MSSMRKKEKTSRTFCVSWHAHLVGRCEPIMEIGVKCYKVQAVANEKQS